MIPHGTQKGIRFKKKILDSLFPYRDEDRSIGFQCLNKAGFLYHLVLEPTYLCHKCHHDHQAPTLPLNLGMVSAQSISRDVFIPIFLKNIIKNTLGFLVEDVG